MSIRIVLNNKYEIVDGKIKRKAKPEWSADDYVKKLVSKPVKKRANMSPKERKLFDKMTNLMVRDAGFRDTVDFVHEKCRNVALEGRDTSGNFEYTGFGTLENEEYSINPGFVFIDSGMKSYRRLDYKTYLKLRTIRYMTLRIHIEIIEDGEEEAFDVFNEVNKISSMNQLFHILNRREGLIEGLMKYHAGLGWYSQTSVTETVCVLHADNTVKKMSFDKFLEKYKIYG